MGAARDADLMGAAERLRSWLDELAVVLDGAADETGPALAAWHRAHAGPLIAAALALEELAAADGDGTA
jgi:hypothetical protein